MRKLKLIFIFLMALQLKGWTQPTAGDYRSFTGGSWNVADNWERFDGAVWVHPAPTYPTTPISKKITIQTGHSITSSGNIGGTTGGSLEIQTDGTFTLNHNLTIPTINISGNFNANAFPVNSALLFSIGSGGHFKTSYISGSTGTTGWWSGTTPPATIILSGTFEYSATANQKVASIVTNPIAYNNLILSGSGSTKNINAAEIIINGLLTINSGVIFDLNNLGATVYGSGITNNGTINSLTSNTNDFINFYGTAQTLNGSGFYTGEISSFAVGDINSFNFCDATFNTTNLINIDYLVVLGSITFGSNSKSTINSCDIWDSGGNPLNTNSDASTTSSIIINNPIINGSAFSDIAAKRYMSGNLWHVTSPIVSGQDSLAFVTDGANAIPTSGSNYGMMAYSESGAGWKYYTNPVSSGAFPSGSGFLVRRTSDGVMTFIGSLVNSTTNISITRSLNGWNCVGNPFTSAIKVRGGSPTNDFLGVNSGQLDPSFAALYIYNPSSPTQYQIINNTDPGGRYISQDYLQPGQGFLIKSKLTGGNLSFTPAMQSHQNTATYYKKSAQTTWPAINFRVNTANKETSSMILFYENMTRGLDVSFDAGMFGGDPALNLYTKLVIDNGVNFAIQCLPDQETSDMIIPIGLDFPAGGLVSFTAEIVTLPLGYKAILEDRQLGIFTDLKVQGAKYDVILPASTNGTGRFFLHTLLNSANTIKSDILKKITSYSVGKEIFVKGQVSENTNAVLYDLFGRKLKTMVLEPSDMNRFRVDELNTGIFILKVEGEGINEVARILIE